MAAKVAGSNLLLVVSVIVGATALAATQVEAGFGAATGGKVAVENVKNNEEVQELGKYCVAEYNKKLKVKKRPQNASKQLKFSEVIKAEKQVVAGLKYYFVIKASTSDGKTMTFDAELMVKPRETVKEMLNFFPAKLN